MERMILLFNEIYMMHHPRMLCSQVMFDSIYFDGLILFVNEDIDLEIGVFLARNGSE